MKVAEVRYNGRSRRHTRRGPSDEKYVWTQTSSEGEDTTATVENIEDALFFDRKPVFEVEWSALGRLVKQSDGAVTEAQAALKDISYREKQKIASALGVQADGKEEELNDRLEPEIEELQEQMEVS